jgi:RNA polymerase sigma-70 factor (ECF subfamily)
MDPGAAEGLDTGEVLPVIPSFAEIYQEQVAFIWRAARGLGVRAESLDDVVQETFVVVHRRLPEWAGRSPLRPWVWAILLNVVRHHRRTKVRKSPHEMANSADPDELRADSRDPCEEASHSEETRLLGQLLDELDDKAREILVLSELEELSVPEIAAILDIKLATAYSRLRLARAKLDQALARHRAQDTWRLTCAI